MKKIFYNYFDDANLLEIVDSFKNRYNWSPQLFLTSDINNLKRFTDTSIIIDVKKVRKGVFNLPKGISLVPIDEHIILELSSFELNYLSWLQDTTGWNFSYQERVNYYYDILTFWNSIILHCKPDVFINLTVPHTPGDYPLYLLLKYIYKIPILFLDFYPYLGNRYMISNSISETSKIIANNYNENIKITPIINDYFTQMKNNPTSPKDVKDYLTRKTRDDKNFFRIYFDLIKSIIKLSIFDNAGVYFKNDKKKISSSYMNNFQFFLFKNKLYFNIKKLKKSYDSLTESPTFSEKFLYFSAPYQPEVFSNLAAGHYENVILILKSLSQVIPDNWKIYYKEHPNTFIKTDKAALYKSKNFYQDLKKEFKNLKFINSDYNQFELIQKSEAVVTVGGTVGWEAGIFSKPVILFGNMWYENAPHIIRVKKYQELKIAVNKIIDNKFQTTFNLSLIKKFAQAVFDSTFESEFQIDRYKRLGSDDKKKNFFLQEKENLIANFKLSLEKLYNI